jgi:hypothetical protein
MEAVLELYERPYDGQYPVICLDERPCQLIGNLIQGCAMQPGRAKRVHHEYERHGVATVFVAIEPLSGKRLLKVTSRRTRADYAEFLREVSAHWPEAEKIQLVQDNLNTHTPGSLYHAFAATEAAALAERIAMHYTPIKGSWLNMAEVELSVLSRQSLNRRIGTQEELDTEVAAYAVTRQGKKIIWRFTKNDARTKFKRHYDNLSIPT